ncbi:MAG TPA: Ig-like domain-containing protein [Paraburkholderia sp.]|nr:Ig-like domain-containing protein [Paraburkholderia sp.]
MVNIRVVEKATGHSQTPDSNDILLHAPSRVTIDAVPSQILAIARNGSRLALRLGSGDIVTLDDFFAANGEAASELVVRDVNSGASWSADYSNSTGEVTLSPVVAAGTAPLASLAPDPAVSPVWTAVPDSLSDAASAASSPVTAPASAAQSAVESTVESGAASAIQSGAASVAQSAAQSTAQLADNALIQQIAFGVAGIGIGAGAAWVAKNDAEETTWSTAGSGDGHNPLQGVGIELTANNLAGLSGTADPAATIVLTLPDGSVVATTANADGTWQFAPNPLADGEQGTLAGYRAGGTVLASVDTGIADVTPPAAPTVDLNNATGLAGTGEPGDTIYVELADGRVLTTIVDESGQWGLYSNPLIDGTSGTVTAVDAAGNRSDSTPTGASDQTPPAALDGANLSLVASGIATDPVPIGPGGTTSNAQPTFAGHIDGNDVASVNVYDNGALIGSTTVDAAGNWHFAPGTPLADGAHDFRAAPVDAAGNEGPKTDGWGFSVEASDELTLASLLTGDTATAAANAAAVAGDYAATDPMASVSAQTDLLTLQQSQQSMI